MCEVQLFNSGNLNKLPENCEVRHGYQDNAHFEKLHANSFVYQITNKIQITLVCPTSTTFHILQGTGILTIPVNCIIYTPSTILLPVREVNKTIVTDFYPELNIIKLDNLADKIRKIKVSEIPLKLSKLQAPNFKNLRESTNSLDYVLTEIEKQNNNYYLSS